MHLFVRIILAFCLICLSAQSVWAQAATSVDTRLKEVIHIEQASPTQLTGYGLVVGLDRTGDRARGQRGAPHTITSITNLLQRFGISVDPTFLTARNVAAVLVTATIDPFTSTGSSIDVTVSAIGDARSLSGGVLIQTPLISPTSGTLHAMAQGPVSTGAVLASSNGSSVQINHTNTGRIPNGGVVSDAIPLDLSGLNTLRLVMKEPDFTNAARVADAINNLYPDAATPQHAGLINVTVPADAGGAPALIASLEELTIAIDVPARVVINERSGIIVAGGNVKVNEVLLTYGSIVISTQTDPFVSQPNPFSNGQTVQGAAGSASIEEDGTRSIVLGPSADVNQLAAALNDLGLTARDVIGIFQAIDRAGALQGDLIIL
ncbi:MAG: flagellar basal body P-ring protein FlgI [Rhodothermaceae bacterium]|nr:flagellar basal body P-ring protein FlgI [Rhodothermaceae bacterium]